MRTESGREEGGMEKEEREREGSEKEKEERERLKSYNKLPFYLCFCNEGAGNE